MLGDPRRLPRALALDAREVVLGERRGVRCDEAVDRRVRRRRRGLGARAEDVARGVAGVAERPRPDRARARRAARRRRPPRRSPRRPWPRASAACAGCSGESTSSAASRARSAQASAKAAMNAGSQTSTRSTRRPRSATSLPQSTRTSPSSSMRHSSASIQSTRSSARQAWTRASQVRPALRRLQPLAGRRPAHARERAHLSVAQELVGDHVARSARQARNSASRGAACSSAGRSSAIRRSRPIVLRICSA